MSSLEEIFQFIKEEGVRLQTYDDNILVRSFSHIVRYREFLDIILGRYNGLSNDFVKNFNVTMEVSKQQGSGPINSEMMGIMNDGRRIGNELQLEIESFYQFAKILLDHIAKTVGVYFGQLNGVSFESHNKFDKSIMIVGSYLNMDGLESLPVAIKSLKTDIVDFRDDHIVHKTSPRDFRGLTFCQNGKVMISKNRLYPKEKEAENIQKNSTDLNRLVSQIDSYISIILTLLKNNREKNSLKT